MILADSTVWVDHLRSNDARMIRLLDLTAILIHPLVLGEIAMGSMKARNRVLETLTELPRTEIAEHGEVMDLVEREQLYGSGIGFVDAHLPASTLLTPGSRLWTRNRRLRDTAARLDVAARPWGRD
jgi:predicted nucleic acid-binding protein